MLLSSKEHMVELLKKAYLYSREKSWSVRTVNAKCGINVLAPDAEQHPVIADSLAIKPMEGWLEPDHIALERVILHFIKVL
jgi:hypothetical protein